MVVVQYVIEKKSITVTGSTTQAEGLGRFFENLDKKII